MQSVISFIMSVITLISSFFGLAAKEPVLPEPTDNFVPVVRFFVCSDTHVYSEYESGLRAGRITKLFDVAYDFAEKDAYYNKLDAGMFVGDCTDKGLPLEFSIFENEIKSGVKDETRVLAVAAKNHDGYNCPECLELISEITGLDSDFHVVINGFHFIGISTSSNPDERYSSQQRKWLKEQLEAAKKDDPNKPIFVCHHEHVKGTVYGSSIVDGWGITYFNDILNQYPQIVHFSGHSHYPLNDPRSVKQGKFITVGTGSMSYSEFTYKFDRKIRPAYNDSIAQAWIVEADASNKIRLTGIDVNCGEILCQYVLPTVTEKKNYVYTDANMKLLSKAPKFPENASLDISKNDDGSYSVFIPKAESTDGMIVFAYRYRILNSNGFEKSSGYAINDYWVKEPMDIMEIKFNAEEGSKIEVYAQNAYYMDSAPLTAEIK